MHKRVSTPISNKLKTYLKSLTLEEIDAIIDYCVGILEANNYNEGD